MSIFKKSLFLITIGTFFSYINVLSAAPTTLISSSGPSSNRIDMVFLGDGYTLTEQAKFAADVQIAIASYFSYEPYTDYASYFNLWRIEVVSSESGADHPLTNTYKDTALDATYSCANSQRLICVNTSTVFQIVTSSVAANEADIVVVLVNDPVYGGSGGALAVASTHSAAGDLVLHETGHSFGLLADEYDYGSCYSNTEPSAQNVTKQSSRNNIKWNTGGGPPNGWIEFSTPVPTTDIVPRQPGLYEGAKYCSTGLFRPTYNSAMRALGNGFDAVNEELLVRRIYNFVSPLESSLPLETSLSVTQDTLQEFNVITTNNVATSVTVTWEVDGIVEGSGTGLMLDTSSLSLGLHSVVAKIRDTTGRVRHDPQDLLSDERAWSIAVTDSGFNETCNGEPVDVYLSRGDIPTSGSDVIWGTSGIDIIYAMGGDDVICALDGDDVVNSGRGDDWVDAGDGNDEVQGGAGTDTIIGGMGDDELLGGPGGDVLFGGGDDDTIFGNSGNDQINGGPGVDSINAGAGDDVIMTGSGATVGSGVFVNGGAGDDMIFGGTDADEIRGSTGNDVINGAGGDDRLFGGGGTDQINGQSGNDYIRGNAAADQLFGGSGYDDIDGHSGNDSIVGGDGDDTLMGSSGNDGIRGESGDDLIYGGGGNDSLYGGGGADTVSGGGGNDHLDGGGAADTCDGEAGIDTASASCEVILNTP